MIEYADLDVVLISPLHADHSVDLVPFSYALTYAPPRQHPAAPARPELYAPAGAKAVVITHYSDQLDAGRTREEATRGYGADVSPAHAGAVYTPPASPSA